MMTLVVVYLYTVVAFNFFRKFYVQESEDGDEPDRKCHNMFTVSSLVLVFLYQVFKIVGLYDFLVNFLIYLHLFSTQQSVSFFLSGDNCSVSYTTSMLVYELAVVLVMSSNLHMVMILSIPE